MSGSGLPNKSYRNIEKKHGVRGKYVLSRVLPWVGRIIYFSGIAAMTYGGINMKNDIEKGQMYFGGGAAASFVSAYALDKRRKLMAMKEEFRLDKENDERIRQEIIKNQSNLEESLSD
jgi:hypothetical protein